MRIKTLLSVSTVVVVLGSSARAQGAEHRFTLEDLLSIQPVGDTALSPDGKTFATVRSGQIVLFPATGGWPVTLTSSAAGKSGLSWSADSRSLAFTSQGSIWTVSVEGGQPHRLTHTPPGEGDPRQAGDRAPHWSPKGDWVLFESGRRGHGDIVAVTPDGLRETILTVLPTLSTGPGRRTETPSRTWSALPNTSVANCSSYISTVNPGVRAHR